MRIIGDLDIISGDVVEHTNTRRVAIVLETKRVRDGTIECRVEPIPNPDPHPIWWNSSHVRQVPRRDPYRRYLAMRDAEDDELRRIRRLRHRRARYGYGPFLTEIAWEKAYWRLCNLRDILPGGMGTSRDTGRLHWIGAATDCLNRRDRAHNYILSA